MINDFSLKSVRITVILDKGPSTNGSTRTYEGLPCEVVIRKPGLPEKNSAQVSLRGLKYEDMSDLTVLAFDPAEVRRNIIQIRAGEAGGTMPLVFEGEIESASADFNSAPNVVMRFSASSGSYPQLKASPDFTTPNGASAHNIFAWFAKEAGYAFVNEGVNMTIKKAVFSGSPLDKICRLARMINCELLIDDGTVTVMPAGKARSGAPVALSAENGLIGYPTLNQKGISCRCLFNPALCYGGLISTQSIVPRASGLWRIGNLTHSLASGMPGGGLWESAIEGVFYERNA